MSDNLRVEALRLATIISDEPTVTVARAALYHSFLEGKIPAAADPKPAPKPAPKQEPAPPPKEPETDPLEEGGFTIDQVRAALKEYRAIEGAAAMVEVLKTHGGSDKLTNIDPSNYAAIMEAVETV